MSLKLIVVAVLLCLTVTFTPITNLKCSAGALGTKSNEFSGEIITPLNDVGFVKVGSQFRSTAKIVADTPFTVMCNNYHKGETYRVVCFS